MIDTQRARDPERAGEPAEVGADGGGGLWGSIGARPPGAGMTLDSSLMARNGCSSRETSPAEKRAAGRPLEPLGSVVRPRSRTKSGSDRTFRWKFP